MDFFFGHLDIFNVFRIKNITAYGKQAKADDDGMNAENNYWKLVIAVYAQKRCGKWNQRDEKEKKRVQVRQMSVNIFGVNRNKKMMRSLISEKQGKTQKIWKENWQHRCKRYGEFGSAVGVCQNRRP